MLQAILSFLGDQTTSIEGVGTPQVATTEDFYDGDGNLTLSVDPDGNSTIYQYDAAGNQTLVIQGYGTSAASETSYGYDAAGNQTLIVTGYGSASPEATFYAYDADGNQTLVVTGYGSSHAETTTSLYDGDGNLIQQTDPDGTVSTFAYDSLGDETLSTLGTAVTHDYYDNNGNLTLAVDADGNVTSYGYDADGNLTLQIVGYGTASASATAFAYDADGNQTLVVTGAATAPGGSDSATFVNTDTTTQGNWQGVYGSQGYNVIEEASSYPSYAQVSASGNTGWIWSGTTSDPRALQEVGNDYRLAACWFSNTSFTVNVDFSDGQTHQLALYLLDWDNNGRSEQIQITDAATGAVLSTETASNFVDGEYLVWDVSGDIDISITHLTGANAVLSGLFIDPTAASASSLAEATSYAYDANGNQTLQVTGYGTPQAATTVSQYDGDGNLTQQTDPDGNVSTYQYDSLGDQTQSTLGSATTKDYYDGDGNVTEAIDADGNITSYQYDADGNQTLMIQSYGSSAASATSYGYDTSGNQTLVVTGYGSSSAASTYYAYDGSGNQTLMVTGYGSPQAETTTSLYDNDGNLTQQTDPDGNVSDYAYDAEGDQTESVIGAGSSNPGTTHDSYDGDGNLTLSVNAVGDSTSYQYDPDGNQTLEIDGYGTSSAATTRYVYDADGNQIQEIDPDGNTTSYEYDADGNQTLMIQAYGTSAAATMSYQYDDNGNVTLQSNPNGTSIQSSYNDQGEVTSEVWYAGSTATNSISYIYDADGNILTASNGAGSYSFGYNADGEETLSVDPNGVTLNYQYDTDGDIIQISDSLGDVVTSFYDANGNPIVRNATGPNGAQIGMELTYDNDNNPTTLSRYGQVNGIMQLVGGETEEYDAQGNLTYIVQASASGTTLDSFSYVYDADGQVTQEVDYNTGTTNYAYDATGQLTSAGATDYSYDPNGNPNQSGDSVGPNNELLSDGTWIYSYDANGNNTGKVGVTGGPDAGLSWVYSYDASNELIGASETNSQSQTLEQASYTYDVFGNLIASSVSINGGTAVVTHYAYNGSTLWATMDASNAIDALYVSGAQPDQFFAQISASNGPDWDLNDRLNSVRDLMNNSGQLDDTIAYDAYGNTVSQTNPSAAPVVGFTGLQVLAGLGFDETDVRDYNPQTGLWEQQDPIRLEAGPNPYEYANDAPTNLTDPSGEEPTAPNPSRGNEATIKAKVGLQILAMRLELVPSVKRRFELDRKILNAAANFTTFRGGRLTATFSDAQIAQINQTLPQLEALVDQINDLTDKRDNFRVLGNLASISLQLKALTVVFQSYTRNLLKVMDGQNTQWIFQMELGRVQRAREGADAKESFLNQIQLTMDLAGLLPVIGIPLNATSAGISAARGDALGASLSLLAIVPVLGKEAGVAKVAKELETAAKAVGSESRYASEVANAVRGLEDTAKLSQAVKQAELNIGVALEIGATTPQEIAKLMESSKVPGSALTAEKVVAEARTAVSKASANEIKAAGKVLAKSLNKGNLAETLVGTTEQANRIAKAIKSGDVGVNILGNELFAKAYKFHGGTGNGSNIAAFAVGNQIYLRKGSASILTDTVHEGTHALDFLKGLPSATETEVLSLEKRAYFYERQYQRATHGEVDFPSVADMLKFIAKNYP